MKRHASIGAVVLLAAACAPAAPELPDLAAARALASDVVSENLMPWVHRLASDHMTDARLDCTGFESKDKYPACELSSAAAVTLVHETLVGFGYDAHIVEQGDAPLTAHTVVAEQRGTRRPQETVLVGAHVDAFYAGADDNGSGVAALLELARVVAGRRFARTVRFVGFDLEERGARGSTRYVKAGMADDVVAALILECVGYADYRAGSQDSPLGLKLGSVGDSLAVAANADSLELAQRLLGINQELGLLPVRVIAAGGSGAFFFTGALLRSDNSAFWLQGIPALMLTDTANFRNPNYHEASDAPDTLDPVFLGAVTRLVAASLSVFAEAEP